MEGLSANAAERPAEHGSLPPDVGPTTSVSVVVPVYNSAATLPALVERVANVLTDRGAPFEIILVDDGSRDRSWEQIEALARGCAFVRGISLRRNSGQHNAVLAGVRAARNEITVTLDDDLQHPPEAIPVLLDALRPAYDLVYAAAKREQHGWWRDAGSRVAKYGVRLILGWGGAASISDFRAFRTELRDGFAQFDGPLVSFDAILAWTTTAIAYLTVDHAPREVGRSNYRISSLVEYGATMATGFSTRPLRVSSVVGLLMAVAGVLTAGVALGRWAATGASPQYLLITAGFGLITAFQFLVLGILGEYLGRVHVRVQPRPAYIVRQEIDGRTLAAGADAFEQMRRQSPQ